MKETSTTTIEETKVETITEGKVINNILFVVFAEFLGYESPIIQWAEDACKGKSIETFKARILNVDACSIFKKMQEKYTIDEIKKWWNEFYPILLEEFEENLKKSESDLPF